VARAEKHRLAAEWIESLAEDRDDHVELLAHHYTSALEFASAAGQPAEELEARARKTLAEAAERAFTLHSYTSARTLAEEALALRPADGSDRAHLLYLRAMAEGRLSETNEEHLLEARDALWSAGEELKAALMSVFLSDHLRDQGRSEWVAELEQALETAERQKPSSEKGWVLARGAWNRQFARNHEGALALAEKALEIGQALDDDEVRAHALDAMAIAKWSLGQDGSAESERSLAAAESARSPLLILNVLGNTAIKWIDEGEFGEASELMQKGSEVARSYGNRWGVAWTGLWPIELAYLEGRWDDAIREVEAYLDLESGWRRFGGFAMFSQGLAARLRLGRGEVDDALDRSEQFLTDVKAAVEVSMLPEALALRARVLNAAGRDEEAGRRFEQCIRDIEERGSSAPGSPPWSLLDLTAAGVRLGRFDELRGVLAGSLTHARWVEGCRAMSDEDYERASELYATLGARSEEAFARLCGAEHLIAEGKRDEAELQLEQALAFFRQAGAAFYIEQAEKLLAASA
jgi:hypothetical protein